MTPKFCPDFPNDIHSLNLVPLFNSSDSLEYMRLLYKKDTLKFYSVRDELILRGINFNEDYQNNFFPHFEIEDNPQKIVSSHGELFKNINFTMLGLPNFLMHFNVQNDLFFNNIPLSGFTFLSKNISNQFVYNVFIAAGFTIVGEEKIQDKNNLKIDQVFKDKGFYSFRRFCKIYKYDILGDLSIKKIEAFGNMQNIGKSSVDSAKERYLSFMGTEQKEETIISPTHPNIYDNKIDQEKIIHFAQDYLNNGYAFSYDIYSDMQFDENLIKLISKYRLDNASKLSFFLKKAILNLEESANFLSLSNSNITSVEQFIKFNFKNKVTRKELTTLLNSKGYSNASVNRFIQKLLNSKQFIEIDNEVIVNRESISFEEVHIKSLEEYLNSEFSEEEFLPVSNLIGFRSELPPLNIGPWTKHLIFHLSTELGYKQIKTFSNFRNEKLILLKANSSIKNYVELIYYLLENKYTGSFHNTEVNEYLTSIGISNPNTNLNNILQYTPLFSVDELGWINLLPRKTKK